MTVPAVTAVRLTGRSDRADLPLLVLGPEPGASALALWGPVAPHLTGHFDVLAWDLPGQGHNRAVTVDGFTVAELAVGVLGVVDDVLEQRGDTGASFAYAGVSVGGAVGLQLLVDVPTRVSAAVLLGTEVWSDDPAFDVRARLGEVGAPLVADVAAVADGVRHGRLVGSLSPADAPEAVAALVRQHVLGEEPPGAGGPGPADVEAVWGRPGLDRRSRMLITLAALAAAGHDVELAAHVAAARREGLTEREVDECLTQTALHTGGTA